MSSSEKKSEKLVESNTPSNAPSDTPDNSAGTQLSGRLNRLDAMDTANTLADQRTGTGFWNVLQSVGAAMIGVQSRKNRERDFQHGKPIHFILGGLAGTALFMLVIWLIVQYLLATSQ